MCQVQRMIKIIDIHDLTKYYVIHEFPCLIKSAGAAFGIKIMDFFFKSLSLTFLRKDKGLRTDIDSKKSGKAEESMLDKLTFAFTYY